jgi:hypothetical protein
MNQRLARILSVLQRLLGLLAILLVALSVAAAFFLQQALQAGDLDVLRRLTALVGTLMSGQRTEHVVLTIRVAPEEQRLVGRARLTVRSLREGRRRFYFLLNEGLRVRAVRILRSTAGTVPTAYQLALLTVVDVGTAVDNDTSVDLEIDYEGTPSSRLDGGATRLDGTNVLLTAETFWFPSDLQGFFTADVSVTAPADLTIVHNGVDADRVQRGTVQEVRWKLERPVGGMSLVAGRYTHSSLKGEGKTYHLYLADDVDLDAERVLEQMRNADDTFALRFGPSGFSQLSLFVSRRLRRAYNDGSGLMGASIRYFRSGDYGFAIVAHEIAHNWWGGTVAEKWLTPGTGGEWIVEGFAGFSSLLAAEARYGRPALTQRLAAEFFDPARQGTLASMSVLDNALAEATARDTIYRKGAYVAMMLRHVLGEEVYYRGLREFVDRYRYQQVTDRDLQAVLEEVSGQALQQFFEDWVRSNKLADLALDGTNASEATVSNLGPAVVTGPIDVWKFKRGGGPPQPVTLAIGDLVRLGSDDEFAILDPLLTWADMQRENNRYPRRRDPVFAATGPGSRVAVTRGETFPWVRATVTAKGAAGASEHAWDFERGFLQPPRWSSNGDHLVVSYSDPLAALPPIIALADDGTRRQLGLGMAPAPGPDGSVYAAQRDRIVRFTSNGRESTTIQRPGWMLDSPLAAPDGKTVAYVAMRGNDMEFRLVGADGNNDRLVLSWDRDRSLYTWGHDSRHLFAVLGGNWDWQVWDIPVDATPVQVLARGAATISSLALSPQGTHLAITAAPELDYPTNRRELFVLEIGARHARTIDIQDADASEVAWLDDDQLLVVANAVAQDETWTLPTARRLELVRLSDASVADFE